MNYIKTFKLSQLERYSTRQTSYTSARTPTQPASDRSCKTCTLSLNTGWTACVISNAKSCSCTSGECRLHWGLGCVTTPARPFWLPDVFPEQQDDMIFALILSNEECLVTSNNFIWSAKARSGSELTHASKSGAKQLSLSVVAVCRSDNNFSHWFAMTCSRWSVPPLALPAWASAAIAAVREPRSFCEVVCFYGWRARNQNSALVPVTKKHKNLKSHNYKMSCCIIDWRYNKYGRLTSCQL